MHWKIARDPYLRPLCARRGEAAVWDSGFFLDDDPDDAPLDDVDWRCTPRPLRAPSGSRPAVLLATGSFCPVHEGHLAMMARAHEAAAAAGWDVLGAYLSPGHDRYVRAKCGPSAIPASERLRLCAEAAATQPGLLVDPWEALARRVAVNFTDVTARLRAYLRAHVHPALEVIYVCGGDNARFALAFAEEGACVVVGRPGAAHDFERWRDALAGNPRVLWADGDHPAASRRLRAPVWSSPRRRLVVRVEDARAVATLAPVDLAAFQRALVAELARHVEVRLAPIDDAVLDARTLTLDPMARAPHVLALSRHYALGGYQRLGHVARPGAAPLDAQAARVPDGDWTLHDDDAVSGDTLAAARRLLAPRVRVVATRVAVAHDDDEDVADSRDFLPGADDGGLVVTLADGRLGRVPYLLPYVDPAVRSCVPPDAARAFSEAVWGLAAAAFEGTGLTVGDMPPPARAAFEWFGLERSLASLCAWHVARLRALADVAPAG